MTKPKDAVANTTDLGTLRPNFPLEPTTGDHFEPLKCPKFKQKINLPTNVKPSDAFAIWSLFFLPEQLEITLENTNKKGRARKLTESKSKHPAAALRMYAQV
jgi:hypothetical protein